MILLAKSTYLLSKIQSPMQEKVHFSNIILA